MELRTSDLASAAGISQSYASEIANGKRQPSRPLAIHIFRKTGWKHALIADLSVEQIDVLETVEPWVPREAAQPEPEQRTHDATSAIDDDPPEAPGIEVHAAALDDPARVCDLCDEPVGDPGKRVCGVVDCPHRVKAAA